MTLYTQTHFLFHEQQITDEGLITICRGCHRLQSLCVSGCANITDAILHALGQNCPRLRSVYTPTRPHSALHCAPLPRTCRRHFCLQLVWKLILTSYCCSESLSILSYEAVSHESHLFDLSWQVWSQQTDVVPHFKRLLWNKCYALKFFRFPAKLNPKISLSIEWLAFWINRLTQPAVIKG